jgi:hypothetical protein
MPGEIAEAMCCRVENTRQRPNLASTGNDQPDRRHGSDTQRRPVHPAANREIIVSFFP